MKALRHLAEAACGLVLWVVARLLRRRRRGGVRVVVTGWYGSETVGDVAILGQILAELETAWPEADVVVATFDSDRTRRSLQELGRTDVPVVAVGPVAAWMQARADYLVFGGGPLMESPTMLTWVSRAVLARLGGARVVLYGCGIGPIRRSSTAMAIGALARSAVLVVVRDAASRRLLPSGIEKRAMVLESFDPAYDYVRKSTVPATAGKGRRRLLLFLRAPSKPYLDGNHCPPEGLAASIARTLDVVAERVDDVDFVGVVMNTGDSSDDDHGFLELLRDRLVRPERLQVRPGHHSLGYVLEELRSSDAALTVRFHGMVFSLAMDLPFVAIDYAVPSGKVSEAAAVAGALDRVVPLLSINPDDLAVRIERALNEPTAPEALEREFAERRIAALRSLRS